MSTEVGAIHYTLDLDKSGFERGISQAKGEASNLGKGLSGYFEGAVGASTKFATALTAVGAAIGVAGGFALKSASDFQQNRIAFETMLGSADKARVLLKQVSDFAAQTPFELPDVVKGAKNLLAFGFSQDVVIDKFKMLGNIAAGVGTDKLPNLIAVFGQVKAAGRLMSQDLLQFTSAGVPVIDLLAEHFKKPATSIKQMVEDGKVSFNDLDQSLALLGGSTGRWGNLMAKQSLTVQGTFSNLQDTIGRVVRNVIGISDTGDVRAGSIFAKTADALNKVLDFLNAHQQQITDFFTKTFEFVAAHWPLIAVIIGSALVPALVSMAGAVLLNMLYLAPFVAIGVALYETWNKARPLFYMLAGALLGVGVAIIAGLVPALIAMAVAGWAAIAPFLPFIAIGALVGLVVYEIISHWQQIVTFFTSTLPAAFTSAWNAITSWFSNVGTTIVNGWNAFTAAFVAGVQWVINAFLNLPMTIAYWLGWLVGRYIRFYTVDLPAFVMAVINWFAQLPGNIANFVNQMANAVGNAFNNARNWAVNAFVNLVNSAISWFASLPGRIAAFAGAMAGTAGNVANSAVNGFIGWFQSLPGRVGGILNNVLGTIGNFAGAIWDKAKQLASGFWEGFKKGLGIHSPSYVEKAFFNIQDAGIETIDQMKKNVRSLNTLSNLAGSMNNPLANMGAMVGDQNNAASIQNNLNGDFYIASQGDADYLLGRLSRSQELAVKGMTTP